MSSVEAARSVRVAFRAGRRTLPESELCLQAGYVESGGGNAGEGGTNLLEFLRKVPLKALGVFV